MRIKKMKWTLYVKENDECKNLLYMLRETPNDTLAKTLKEVKPALFSTTAPYITSGNKKITKLNKIIAKLTPVPQQRRPQQQNYEPPANYSNYNYDDGIIGMAGNLSLKSKVADEDELPERNDKEELARRVADMESRRQAGKKIEQAVPDPVSEQKYSENMDSDMYNTIQMEEDLEKYFKTTMAGSGN